MKTACFIALKQALILLMVLSPVIAQSAEKPCSQEAVSAITSPGPFTDTIHLTVGKTTDLKAENISRYLVGAPNLISANKSEDGTFLKITGRKEGRTLLNIWDKDQIKRYQVIVEEDDRATAQSEISSQEAVSRETSLTLKPGDSRIIRGKGITRTATSNPEAIDIVPVSTTELIFNAKNPGTSIVRVWDDQGLSTYNITVETPEAAKVDLAEQISREIGIPTVRVKVVGTDRDRTITLLGDCSNKELSQLAEKTASAYGKVQNFILVQSAAPTRVVDALKETINDPALQYRVLPDETILIEGSVPSHEAALRVKWIVQTWIGTSLDERDGVRATSTAAIISDDSDEVFAPDVKSRARLRVGTDENRGVPEVSASDDRNITRYVWGGRIPDGPRLVTIINVNPALSRQVLVRAQIIEIDRTRLKDLGIEWGEINASVDAQGNLTFNFVPQPFIIGEDPTEDTIRPIDEIGPLRRLRSLGAQINALIQESKARILAEPKVLISDGGVANIHLGGQIPIPVAQASLTGTGSITVDWKDFGILLTVRPQITEDRRVYMTLTPEASALDFTNAVVVNGFTIPAIRQRRATTVVHVNNNESLVIGGLISSEDVRTVRRIPLLSKIPIIGELFKSQSFTRNESELIILVTPQIIERGTAPSQ